MTTEFHIIYPKGVRSELKVLEYNTGADDLHEYALASRKTFYSFDAAEEYARSLAVMHGKKYAFADGQDYLD